MPRRLRSDRVTEKVKPKIDPRVEKANAEYLAEFGGDPRKAYMGVPIDHPAYVRLKAKLSAIDAEEANE